MTARWVVRWTAEAVEIQPWQVFHPRMVEAGLVAADGKRQAWFIAPDGQVHGGAGAINEALKYVWWLKPVAYLYAIPGLKQIEDWLYRWVARNRSHFPGVVPGCEAEFDCRE